VRAASKAKNRKDPILNAVSVDRVEHCYNLVTSHFRAMGTWNKTIVKFPPRAIYAAVKKFLERSPSDALDIAVSFEELRDFETVDGFIEYLEKQYEISKDHSDIAYDYALEEVTQKVEILGLKLLDKNEVAVNKHEYYYLLRRDSEYKKLKKYANGWPLSLC
jgi:hypothetical protein